MRATTALMGAAACCLVYGVSAHPGHDQAAQTVQVELGVFVAFQQEDDKAVNQVEIVIDGRGAYRFIRSNGIPDHTPGKFPNRGNPNAIRAQRYVYRVPAKPQAAEETTSVYGQPFGVALNGVPFDPGTAEVWSPRGRVHARGGAHDGDHWNYDALSGKIDLGLDDSNAHVQPTGAYHYHGVPQGLVKLLDQDAPKQTMTLVGYAADGFPIYSEYAHDNAGDAASKLRKMKPSYRLKEGNRPGGDDAPGGKYDGTFIQDFEYVEGLGDLDECNGRTGVTPEYPDGTYYYVLTESYPMIPRAFRGTPDKSFERRRGPRNEGGPPERDRRDRRPPPRDGDRRPPR
jgi:hypothetical protein